MAYPDVFAQGLEYTFDTVEVGPSEHIDLGTCGVEVFEMDHSVVTNGYRFCSDNRAIAISGDTIPCSGLIAMSQDTDLLITECSYPESLPGVAHTSLTALRAVAPELGAQRIAVIHTDGISDVAPFEQPNDGDIFII